MPTEEPKKDTTEEPKKEETAEPSFKDDPKYLAMSKQLAEFQRKEAERVNAEAAAKKEAEIKELEAKGQYEAAIKAREAELEAVKKQHAQDILNRDIEAGLLKVGFNNELFIKGAIASYSPEEGDISAFIEKLDKDENNNPFKRGVEGRTVHSSSGLSVPGSTTNAPLRGQKLREYEKSPDKEKRLQAIAAKEDWWNKHGNLDGLY